MVWVGVGDLVDLADLIDVVSLRPSVSEVCRPWVVEMLAHLKNLKLITKYLDCP